MRWTSECERRSVPRRRSLLSVEALETRYLLSLGGVLPIMAPVAAGATLPGGDTDRVSTDLLIGYQRAEGMAITPSLQGMNTGSATAEVTDAQGRVEVNITTGNAKELAPILTSLGVDVVSVLPQYNQVEGYIPWSALPAVSDLGSQGLMGIIGVEKPMTSAGSVTSEGVNVMEADRVQASTPGYNGSGTMVGVLSDSYNNLGGAAMDVSTGDLPAGVQVIQDTSSGGTDEGRAMMQTVHDVAPGSPLAFATADISEGQFANNIQALANNGAKVIADDVFYVDEPVYQPGIVAQAVNNVVTNNGVSYFSSAGNQASQAYDTASPLSYGSNALHFVTDTIPGIYSTPESYFDFDPSAAVHDKMTITLGANESTSIGMQWDQPYYTVSGVTTDLDIFLLKHSTGQVVAFSADDNIANQTPFEFLQFQNGASAAQYDIVINKFAGPNPGEIHLENLGSGGFGTFATNSGTINPHAAVANAMAVGAVPFFNQRDPESFSSTGPVTFLFDANGNRLAVPQSVAKPDIMAPDGASNTFFGGSNINGFPNFFGTSDAAPHAAGVAALILQANPGDTPAQVYSAMKSTADPNIGSGNVNQVGAGLIDAYRAINGNPVSVSPNTADGFETGVQGIQWQVYTSGAGRSQVSSANGPSSGTYQLVMDSNAQLNPVNSGSFYTEPVLDESILNANLAGLSNVTLAFDEKMFTNAFDAAPVAMPASFTGHNNSSGVAFSVDGGTTWYRIVSLTGANSTTSYQTETFNLSTIATADSVTLGANTLIKFQNFDSRDFMAPNSGIALDNVKVQANSLSSVVGRDLFYAGSSRYDLPGGSNPQTPLAFSDDNAIATDKSAYLPGSGAATLANVSSYMQGINGIMVDLLGGGTHSAITASDFIFKTGNTTTVDGTWTTLSGAALPTVSVRLGMTGAANGAGTVSGSDRIELIWASGTITQKWLEVTVLADAQTGLAANDVFFFGSEIGDTGPSNTTTIFKVGALDTTGTQTHLANPAANIPITNIHDFNRDGSVGALDITVDQTHGTNNSTGLQVINIGSGGPFAPPPGAGPAISSSQTAVASAWVSSSQSPPPPAISPLILNRLAHLDLNHGRVATYFQHLAIEGTAKSKAILVNVDQVADDLGLDDELLDGLLVGLKL